MLLKDKEDYRLVAGDVIPHLHQMPEVSVDLAVFSPPFPAVYSYTDLASDLGNSEELKHEAKLHFSFFFRGMLKVMKPGRVMAVHCTQIVRMKRSGGQGLYNFRDLLIRLGVRAGFVYDYDWLIPKNPQAQAIRTKSRSLQFAGLEADRVQSRGAMGDYIIKFLAPGENAVPVCGEGQVTRNDWIDWAESHWNGIKESDTLNKSEARSDSDVKHICPLQLPVIRRLVKLYTNPGEIVFSPFAGIGSEGYEALKLERRFYGMELKPEYHAVALKNLARAMRERTADEQSMLFAMPGTVQRKEPAKAAVAEEAKQRSQSAKKYRRMAGELEDLVKESKKKLAKRKKRKAA